MHHRLSERTVRRVINYVVAEGLLAPETPKGAVSLNFPVSSLEQLFSKLFRESRIGQALSGAASPRVASHDSQPNTPSSLLFGIRTCVVVLAV